MPLVRTGPPSSSKRHPMIAALVGGLDLSPNALRAREDAEALTGLIETLANAEYWLSFDVAKFERTLLMCPSPIRELGVGVMLRFGETVDGRLSDGDLDRFNDDVGGSLPESIREGVSAGIQTLRRTIDARDRTEWPEGFSTYEPATQLSVHTLRAHGSADIHINGAPASRIRGAIPVTIGTPFKLEAFDARGQPLPPPEIENALGAQVLVYEEDEDIRHALLRIPGHYRVRVPGRAEGERKLLAH